VVWNFFIWCYKYCAQMSFRSEYYRGSTFTAGLKNAVLAGLCAVGNTPIEYCRLFQILISPYAELQVLYKLHVRYIHDSSAVELNLTCSPLISPPPAHARDVPALS